MGRVIKIEDVPQDVLKSVRDKWMEILQRGRLDSADWHSCAMCDFVGRIHKDFPSSPFDNPFNCQVCPLYELLSLEVIKLFEFLKTNFDFEMKPGEYIVDGAIEYIQQKQKEIERLLNENRRMSNDLDKYRDFVARKWAIQELKEEGLL